MQMFSQLPVQQSELAQIAGATPGYVPPFHAWGTSDHSMTDR
jgi:hypothetical protein